MTDAERIAALETKVDVLSEYTHVLYDLLLQVLEEAHRKGAFRMQDVAKALEMSKAFGHAVAQRKPSYLVPVIVQSLRDMGDALDAP